MRSFIVAFVVGFLVGAVTMMPTGARAEEPKVYTWETRTIGVYLANHLGPRWRVEQALAYWSQGPVQLVLVDHPVEHGITIRATSPYMTNINGTQTDEWSGLAHLAGHDPLPHDDAGDGIDDTVYLTSCRIDVQRRTWTNPRTVPWRSHVMAHEIGHCLGLPHLDRLNGVMANSPNHITAIPSKYEMGLLWQAYAGVPE